MSSRPAAPPAPKAPAPIRSPRATHVSAVPLNISSGVLDTYNRGIIYGTGGIGKTTLAAYLPAPFFIDVEHGSTKLNVSRDFASSFDEVRGKLAWFENNMPEGIRSIVIDTGTELQDMAKEKVISTRRTEKGKEVDSIEGYGWGKGWQFVYDEMDAVLADLDRLVEKHGVMPWIICHDIDAPVPNPAGEDYIRWEPSLYGGDKKGRANIRGRFKNWAEYVVFIGYDVHVADGKGRGSGTRTLYTEERPTHIAKSRTAQISMEFDLSDPGALWRELGIVK